MTSSLYGTTNDPRKAALSVLNQLDKGNRTLDRILEDIMSGASPFSKKDTGLFHTLVYGVLRWRGRLDWIISYFSKTRIKKIHPNVLNIMRMGLFQIVFLDKIPVSAAVNTSVNLVKSSAAPWAAGFVNSLLRNAAGKYKTVPFPSPDKDPETALAAGKSFPKWLVKRWIERFGYNETENLCDAVNKIPGLTIRANTLKISRENLMENLKTCAEEIIPAKFSPQGITLSGLNTSIPGFTGFNHGWFQVQDEAAQLVTHLLNPQPGETILDACAGLGGKTGHMGQMMKNQGKITAMDSSGKKLSRLEDEMKRLGISIVNTFVHDLSAPPDRNKTGTFDRILLDAPCSGLGVIRRNPDTRWSLSKNNLAVYKDRQIQFLNNLVHLLNPWGRLTYAVCSTEPEENEMVVRGFLDKHPEFKVEKNTGVSDKINSLMTKKGYFKTFPHLNDMDGFFSVCFKLNAEKPIS